MAPAFGIGWAIGCTVNPFPGINVALQDRYGASAVQILRGNVVYALVMCALGVVVLDVLG